MTGGLLDEYEVMLNVGLGASALAAYTKAFTTASGPHGEPVTLWHLATVLPLVFHRASRKAISKRRADSGLRSILARDPANDIAQNEAIFNITRRARATYPRTLRSVNCAIAAGLLEVVDGAVLPGRVPPPSSFSSEARDILKAAKKLGGWAGRLSSFEYFTILGLEIHR